MQQLLLCQLKFKAETEIKTNWNVSNFNMTSDRELYNSDNVELPAYEYPPRWLPPEERRHNPNYNNDPRYFLPRTIHLYRAKVTDALGFNIRGGKEHYCGIYISKVMPNTEAERLGLKEGDQIMTVNNTSFDNIEHAQAVKILKSNPDIKMQVRAFPYGYSKTYPDRPASFQGSFSNA